MKEFDLLKRDWQKNEGSYDLISEAELYKMLHKKSSSIVKRIFIIGVLEILLWTIVSIFLNSDDYFKNLKFGLIFEIFNYLNYLITLLFIYFFYRNYIAISTTVATKKLMETILKTRKTVQFYVWYNLSVILISILIGFYMGINSNKNLFIHDDNSINLLVLIAVIVITMGLILGFFWLFYRLLYGVLLKKLHANYKELKKMEE